MTHETESPDTSGGITDHHADFSDLKALFLNCTLTRSPDSSHTEKLIRRSQGIMERQGVQTTLMRPIDHDIATAVWPNMTEHGWDTDAWPEIYKLAVDADILVLAGPIWLGDNSSQMKKTIERLYACSSLLNDRGQYAYYGKVGGCLITGNEDGIKHCAMNVLYSLQHLGYSIPPQADAGWIGEAGPGPSYGDDGAGLDNDFTNRNTTIMSWNLMHLAQMLQSAGGDAGLREPAERVGCRRKVRPGEPRAQIGACSQTEVSRWGSFHIRTCRLGRPTSSTSTSCSEEMPTDPAQPAFVSPEAALNGRSRRRQDRGRSGQRLDEWDLRRRHAARRHRR